MHVVPVLKDNYTFIAPVDAAAKQVVVVDPAEAIDDVHGSAEDVIDRVDQPDGWTIELGPNRELTLRLPDGAIHSTGPPGRRTAA